MVLVNLCVKNPDTLVNYHFTHAIQVESLQLNNVNFHIPTLVKEVKRLPKSKIHQYKQIIQTFLVTTASFTIVPLRSMANTSIPTGTTTPPQSATGMPPELLDLLLTLLKISVGAAVILAAILLVANAIGRMFRIAGMTQWAKDILKALVQVMVSVPLVFLIYYVANLLFGGHGWFVSPF